MQKKVRFYTPENIAVTYYLAGPGTRFVAYVFNVLLIVVGLALAAAIFLVSLLILTTFDVAIDPGLPVAVAVAVAFLLMGFFYFAYFILFEWMWNGQTPGARTMNIRVVMDEGFSLTLTAVIIRNLFRIIDSFPLFWIVPLFAEKTQRLGDLTAGTLVVSEREAPAHALRDQLLARAPGGLEFTFNPAQLNALLDSDVETVEMFLERRPAIHPEHRGQLAMRLVRGLTRRMELEEPIEEGARERFLEDLLTAYVRREAQELG